MKETIKLKKRNLHDGKVVENINGEEIDIKSVGKMQRKKKDKVGNASEQPQAMLQAISNEKPKGKKVELKGKTMQKSKRKAEDTNSSQADDKLNVKMQKKRKAKGGRVEISDLYQTVSGAISNENIKVKKRKLNKTRIKRKAEEIKSGDVDDEDEDDHLIEEVDGDKGFSEAVNGDMENNETEIRNCKSKKSNKKKKMDWTSTKQIERSSEKMNEIDEEEDVYQISSGDEDCSRGMKKWVTDYYESRPSLDKLQKRIDDFMTSHEEHLEQRQNREAKAAEGGWTVVVHHKGRKKTTESESGTTVGSASQAAIENKIAKKKQNEPVAHGFYRFQRREAQRNEILALQSKFEQDKKRIQQLRAARKFKPY